MMLMALCGFFNHVTVRFGHYIGLRDEPLGASLKNNIKFDLTQVDQFLYDRYFKEEALSFVFDMDLDLTPLMNWNTHTVFATLVCEYSTEASQNNQVTVWDQRVMRAAPEHHHIQLENESVEYYITDINR